MKEPFSFEEGRVVQSTQGRDRGGYFIVLESSGDGYVMMADGLNHRLDRPDRALLFARHFFPRYTEVPLYLCGPGLSLPARLFSEAGVKTIIPLPVKSTDARTFAGSSQVPGLTQSLRILPNLPEGSLLVGIGNIKGPGYSLIMELDELEGRG